MNLLHRYRRLTLWNKLAVWGSIASLVGILLTLGFSLAPLLQSSSSAASSSRQAEPTGFSLHDPRLKLVRSYELRKESGSRLQVGNCPAQPCFRIELRSLSLLDDPPTARISVAANAAGNQMLGWRGLGLTLRLRQGCHFVLTSVDYDLIFEIQDDRAELLRAWVAIMTGSSEAEGLSLNGPICPGDPEPSRPTTG